MGTLGVNIPVREGANFFGFLAVGTGQHNVMKSTHADISVMSKI